MVVLDANPLHDIRNTQKIHSLMARGRYISATERKQMLDEAEEAAKATPREAARTTCCS